MEQKSKFRSTVMYSVVVLVATLLLINILLIYQNSLTIEQNKKIQEEAENTKVGTLDIIRDLHLLDLGLRGYALVNNPALLSSVDTAKLNRGRIFRRLETSLKNQNYPGITRFYELRDSVDAYFTLVDTMLDLVVTGRREEFIQLLNQDRGYRVWLQYKEFSRSINEYEDSVVVEARENYERALRNSYLLQLLIFLLAVPALVYMAYYASRAFRFSEELRHLQNEQNRILEKQNAMLDKLVKEKTLDILAQNEEIMAQNEETRAHNDQLVMQQQEIQKARQIIEKQAEFIQQKNVDLTAAVEKQTHDLRQTNLELVEQNNRLEQFAFIISHNLRAPLARVQGLASILNKSKNQDERENVLRLLVQSSQEFDTVITDLSSILSIQKSNTKIRSEVVLTEVLGRVLSILEEEIRQVQATISVDIHPSQCIQSLAPYVESIFYNLISNAIKYRNPARPLVIQISTEQQAVYLCVYISDNGLGIDLQRHKDQLFNLYKRFHLHTEGKGLGLYLVKTQIEALGGRIEVESKVDEGTTFRLYFK
jgi:signal transduction histidine kinase